MRRLFTLLLLASFVLSVSAIDESKNIRPVVKKSIDFKKPSQQLPENILPKAEMSAAPDVNIITPFNASEAKTSPLKVVKDENGVYQVTADHFAYAEAFEGGWFMSLFSDEQEDGDYYMFKFHFKTDNPNSPAAHLTSLDQLVTESVDRTGKHRNYGHTESAQLDTIIY